MRILRYLLASGVFLCIAGLVLAVLAGDRELGRSVFMTGFFLTAFSAVADIIGGGGRKLGKMTTPLRVTASGFGLTLIGQLGRFTLENGDEIASVLFYIGMLIMLIGIGIGFLASRH